MRHRVFYRLLGKAELRRIRFHDLRHTYISHTPWIESLPEHNTCTGFFEQEQFDALVGHLPEYLRDMTRFAFYIGWRKGIRINPIPLPRSVAAKP